MKHYIVDGNNLIGKIKSLKELQKKDKLRSREHLAYLIQQYFNNKNVKVSLHFDGFPSLPLNFQWKIIYSEKITADEKIKEQIKQTSNRKNLVVISSDVNLIKFAREYSCGILTSEEFRGLLEKRNTHSDEKKTNGAINVEEWKKLFE